MYRLCLRLRLFDRFHLRLFILNRFRLFSRFYIFHRTNFSRLFFFDWFHILHRLLHHRSRIRLRCFYHRRRIRLRRFRHWRRIRLRRLGNRCCARLRRLSNRRCICLRCLSNRSRIRLRVCGCGCRVSHRMASAHTRLFRDVHHLIRHQNIGVGDVRISVDQRFERNPPRLRQLPHRISLLYRMSVHAFRRDRHRSRWNLNLHANLELIGIGQPGIRGDELVEVHVVFFGQLKQRIPGFHHMNFQYSSLLRLWNVGQHSGGGRRVRSSLLTGSCPDFHYSLCTELGI